jgi:hypothetical protein
MPTSKRFSRRKARSLSAIMEQGGVVAVIGEDALTVARALQRRHWPQTELVVGTAKEARARARVRGRPVLHVIEGVFPAWEEARPADAVLSVFRTKLLGAIDGLPPFELSRPDA